VNPTTTCLLVLCLLVITALVIIGKRLKKPSRYCQVKISNETEWSISLSEVGDKGCGKKTLIVIDPKKNGVFLASENHRTIIINFLEGHLGNLKSVYAQMQYLPPANTVKNPTVQLTLLKKDGRPFIKMENIKT